MTSEFWAGFSEEDIEKIKSNCQQSHSDKLLKESPAIKQNGPLKIKKMPKATKITESCNVKKEIKLSDKPLADCNRLSPNSSGSYPYSESCTCEEYDSIDGSANLEMEPYSSENEGENCNKCDETEESLPPLEIFELRQKRVQAENARRRALINKAINDKKKRTQAEAIKLAKITHELNRLDGILSADVSLLRDYIEKASIEFSEAEKRYLKAEKEFVQAKLLLFEKMQRKEMLTEHLCAIIEQNENRKANKLVELMKELEVEAIIEDYEDNTEPILSNLCVLNEDAYHSCQTLKPSNKPEIKRNDTNTECSEEAASSENQQNFVDLPAKEDQISKSREVIQEAS